MSFQATGLTLFFVIMLILLSISSYSDVREPEQNRARVFWGSKFGVWFFFVKTPHLQSKSDIIESGLEQN